MKRFFRATGLAGTSLPLGKHSGRHAFRERVNHLGYSVDDQTLDKAFESTDTMPESPESAHPSENGERSNAMGEDGDLEDVEDYDSNHKGIV